jgi:hypothetical protein
LPRLACPARWRAPFFFEADVIAVEETPDRAGANLYGPRCETFHDLLKRQVGLNGNQLEQKGSLVVQNRTVRFASGVRFDPSRGFKMLHPLNRRTVANLEPTSSCPSRHPLLDNRTNDTFANVQRVRHPSLRITRIAARILDFPLSRNPLTDSEINQNALGLDQE